MISKHFKRVEFTCRCGCGFDTVDAELITVLEDLREWSGNYILVTSGCRCIAHNESVGGSELSQHVQARAADVMVCGKTSKEVHDYLCERYPDKYGIGSYETFTHIDTRTERARW